MVKPNPQSAGKPVKPFIRPDYWTGLIGWRRILAAWVAGLATSLALPPLYVLPALPVGFVLLIWLLDGAKSRRQSFMTGWWFGMGHFVTSVYWVANALLTDPDRFGWMIPFAVGGLAAILALFPATAALLARFFWHGPQRLIIFAVAWTLLEMARSVVATGFPWNPVGHVWGFSPVMMQAASLFGVWGLSTITMLASVAPAAFFGKTGTQRWVVPGVAVTLLVAQAVFGFVRLPGQPVAPVPGLLFRLVQPAIAQTDKNRAEFRPQMIETGLALSHTEIPGNPQYVSPVTHVIWPESAVPYLLDHDEGLRKILSGIVPPDGFLLTGTLRATLQGDRIDQIWNSFAALDGTGSIRVGYDKTHLVPFGEYVPFRNILPFLNKITPGGTDFSAGPGPKTIRLAGLPPFSVLICYEAIFPHAVIDAHDRPSWMLNITNDAWFGDSAGPRQHFVSARLRAVEEGLPLVRAANSGISGVVDPYGRVTASLDLGQRGTLDVALPQALEPTLYGLFGNWTIFGFLVVLLGGAILLRFPISHRSN